MTLLFKIPLICFWCKQCRTRSWRSRPSHNQTIADLMWTFAGMLGKLICAHTHTQVKMLSSLSLSECRFSCRPCHQGREPGGVCPAEVEMFSCLFPTAQAFPLQFLFSSLMRTPLLLFSSFFSLSCSSLTTSTVPALFRTSRSLYSPFLCVLLPTAKFLSPWGFQIWIWDVTRH